MPSSVFQWRDVTYGVGVGNKSKEILKGISGSLGGHADGGEVCSILGPSGSGKTSLLNVLANRIRHKGPAKRVSGVVTLDGKELVGQALRKRIAYVMQQDLLYATQTPRESLRFSAMLRLPRSVPLEEKKAKVAQMLEELGLESCADTYCGDELLRGISGGEKKRTAIGVELVMQPKLIFLDEPTSGLDSFSAQVVINKLVSLAKNQGCNVLCTIHQPSSGVFHTFTKAFLMYSGKGLYFGAIPALSAGLLANGHGCPAEHNLADHALDVIQTSTADHLDALTLALARGGGGGEVTTVVDVTVLDGGTEAAAVAPSGGAKGGEKLEHAIDGGAPPGAFWQTVALTRRELQNWCLAALHPRSSTPCFVRMRACLMLMACPWCMRVHAHAGTATSPPSSPRSSRRASSTCSLAASSPTRATSTTSGRRRAATRARRSRTHCRGTTAPSRR